tara:strand:+ start:13 stop:297 length:285 start_codon:yes stop_codon:yes gene_type:complete
VGEIPWDLHQRVGALDVWGFGIEEQYDRLGMDDCFIRTAYNAEFAMCDANGVSTALNGRMISIEPIQHLANADIRSRVLSDTVSGREASMGLIG